MIGKSNPSSCIDLLRLTEHIRTFCKRRGRRRGRERRRGRRKKKLY